ncbi:Ankyrin repeat domain-containing 50-like protein [Cladobotryum mycophilum]|uniref:Ankyrin repeat domain-containing 50-like protein n=1 Tax=Cladobotryum mycophilum TaxID=491253 RepID=A0ABR0S8I4_9HYPO
MGSGFFGKAAKRLTGKLRSVPRSKGQESESDAHSKTPEPEQQGTLTNLRLENVPIRQLWNAAYEKLREEDGELVAEYETKCQGNVVAGLGSVLGSKAILETKMKEVDKNVWKLKFRSSEVEVREIVQPILGVVSSANEYIAGAVSVNPYASLGWVGISLLLPLFTNSSTQAASMANGLAFVSSLIAQSRMREELYFRRYESKADEEKQSFQQSHCEYKRGLERLYREILKFQATSYCYYANHSAFRLGLDIVKWNDWDAMVDSIRQQEMEFARLNEAWRDIQYDEECTAAANRHQETIKLWFSIGADVSGLLQAVRIAQLDNNRASLLDWLCDINHTEIYNGARDRHEPGTGEWLIKDAEFENWEKNHASFLWLHGKAGSGKSILSSVVIKHLEDRHSTDASITLAYFYFSFNHRLPTVYTAIGAISFEAYKNKGGRPETKVLEKALIDSMQGFSAVYAIIDALDECPMLGDQRKKLLASLGRVLKAAPNNFHLLCTSRKETDIDKEIRPILSTPLRAEFDLSKQRKVLDDDIEQYIDSTLATTNYDTWPDDIKEESKLSLLRQADGMFQYIRCQFEILQHLSSKKAIREALQNLPDGLDETYDRMFQNIHSNFKHQVMKTLKWLAFSIKPLDIDELAEVFVLPNIDGESVRLAHFSIKEYLTSDRISERPTSTFSFTEADAHMWIASSCLAYHLHVSSIIGEKDTSEYKLVGYTAQNWIEHLEMIPRAAWPSQVSRDAALALMANSHSLALMISHTSTYLLFKDSAMRLSPHSYTTARGCHQLTELLVSINKYLTQEDVDIGLRDAASFGTINAVKLFLDMGAGVNQEFALQEAAARGHTAVVELLLDRGADINALGGEFGSALQGAAYSGHLDVLQLLVRRGADVNRQSNERDCALAQATRWAPGLECLQFLLDHGADINMQGGQLGTALCVAARYANDEAFDLLLERGADIEAPGGLFEYPLQVAVAAGGLGGTALQILCAQSLPVPETDKLEKLQLIRSLIAKCANINAPGGYYGTVLQAACSAVNTSLVELLLESGADVNVQGGFYGNALQAASACLNSEELLCLLLGNGADPDAKGGEYGTALQAACANENIEGVRLLLENGADVNVKGGKYGTALQAACAVENIEQVGLLLEKGADVNANGGKHGTALEAAFIRGNTDVVRLLLENNADVHLENCRAWHAAAGSRVDDTLLESFLDRGVHVNDARGPHGTALHALLRVEIERSSYVDWFNNRLRFLLKRGADVNLVAGEYGPALQAACAMPLGIDVNAQGGLFCTALQAAAYTGRTESIALLLRKGARVNIRGGKYGSALNAAIVKGHWNIVQILLDAGATPDCHELLEPGKEWLDSVRKEHGRGAVERYEKFWEGPGFGKTSVLAVGTLAMVATFEQIYCTAPTNIAVENFATRIVQHDINVVERYNEGRPAEIKRRALTKLLVHGHELEDESNIDIDDGLNNLREVATQKITWEEYQMGRRATRNVIRELLREILAAADIVCTSPSLSSLSPYKEWKQERAKGIAVDEAGSLDRADLYTVWGNTLLPCLIAGDDDQLPLL